MGKHVLHLRVVGLNGRTLEATHTVQVTSRKSSVQTRMLADGSIEFRAAGCSNVSLQIPANRTETGISTLHGCIRHAFLIPTDAFLTYTDDDGVEHKKRVVLQRITPGRWKT